LFLTEIDLNIIRGDESPKKNTNIIHTCSQCSKTRDCINSKIPVYGRGTKKILLVLDSPSESEDKMGFPWRGAYGQVYREEIEELTGIDFEKDCWTVYAVRCRGKVNSLSVGACRERLHADIQNLDPRVIIPFGYWATMGVSGDILNNKTSGNGTTDWAGEVIPDQRFQKWILPTWEPFWSNVLDDTKQDTIYIRQTVDCFTKALDLLNTPIKKRNDEKRIKVIENENRVITALENLIKAPPEYMAFDYETTGRKPYRKCHRIYSAALSDGLVSYAFPFFDTDNFRQTWKKLMRHRSIKWIAHNAKFEWIWTKAILGYFPRNLEADTMLMSKVYNNQRRVGLKPLVYCNYGVAGYDDSIDRYLETPKKETRVYGANGFNLIEQAPMDMVLKYNAFDPLYTYWLYETLKEKMTKKQEKAWRFFSQSSVHLAIAETNGMYVDTVGVEREKKDIEKTQNLLLKDIVEEAEKQGWDKQHTFRPSAAADIQHLIFNIMDYEPISSTKTGASTDKVSLEKINEPIVKKILDWKKYDKLAGTYLDGVMREVTNKRIHPFFNLHTVITYRSSSDSPNFQNFPKRDKAVSRIIRSLLKPYPGHKLVEYDYKGIEVAISTVYNRDPNLIKYVTDASTDMHRDCGEELFMFKRGELSGYDRGIAKNKFVFPEFYGSWYEECAKNLWDSCSKEAKENLKNNGVRHLTDYIEFVKQIEKDFWDNRFPVYKQWKKDIYKQYLKKGFIETHLGFRFYGHMKKNDVCNYQTQGTAFHCLLRTFSKLSEHITRDRLQSRVMGQIHDSVIVSVHPDEEPYIDYIMWNEGCKKIVEDWKWITVPLQIEKSVSPVDGSWAEIVEAGLLDDKVPIIKVWKD